MLLGERWDCDRDGCLYAQALGSGGEWCVYCGEGDE